jgi:hypothetical protein
MKVILFKLNNPGNKHEWFVKDIEIRTLDDIAKLVGYCSNHIYAEVYQIDKDDDLTLVKRVKECLSSYYPETAKNTILFLFNCVKKLADLNE